ncbi:hypothetical protein [Chamaesiphon sp. VAR_48_metabat_403]|uniref:hypothetical protein n=1 Tax=Chamaesiphon sp. VAR_48_metabat_403 TaxID=2964700 RepID=UPI00286D8EEA|nr:hypothetical protein [Chamaesiphon sp. VAR_48_metabat_403]
MTDRLKSAEMMPGSFGLPIFGEIINIISKQELFYWQQHQQHGNVFKTAALGFGKAACPVGPEARANAHVS